MLYHLQTVSNDKTQKHNTMEQNILIFYSRSFHYDITMSCLDSWNTLFFKAQLISNWHYIHSPCSPFCLPRLHPVWKSRFFNYSGRNGEDSLKALCLACFESECPVAWHNQRCKIISGSAVWVKADAICFQAWLRIRRSSHTACVLHHSD